MRVKLYFLLVVVSLFFVLTSISIAYIPHIPPELELAKWYQPPNLTHPWNEASIYSDKVVADDWQCLDPRPVTDLHWWGSYIGYLPHHNDDDDGHGDNHDDDNGYGDSHDDDNGHGDDHDDHNGNGDNGWDIITPPSGLQGFHISIHSNVSAKVDPDMPWSHPGELLHEEDHYFGEQEPALFEEYYGSFLVGEYDSHDGDGHDDYNHYDDDNNSEGLYEHKFEYTLYLREPFDQIPGTIYWLDIAAIMDPDAEYDWGWENSSIQQLDDAVTGIPIYDPSSGVLVGWNWEPLKYSNGASMDMAFAITVPEPSSLFLLASGLLGLVAYVRKRTKI